MLTKPTIARALQPLLVSKNTLRTITTIAIAGLLLSACSSSPPPANVENACRIFASNPDWYKATKATQKKWGVPINVQLAIIYQESRFKQHARPGRVTALGIPLWRKSSAYGYAQVKDGTWKWYMDKTGRSFASRDDFDDAVDFIGWYTNVSKRTLGISKWDARNQYLAYHEGHGGFKRKTYNKKAWLVKVAAKVQRKATQYASQLKGCEGRFSSGGGWSLWPF